jgi:uncharacterized membrane protein YdbT with pleckstrin-like domain
MDTGTALGGTGLFFSIVGIVYSAINHKHIRSKCCGKVYEVSIDIDPIETVKKQEEKEKKEKEEQEEKEKKEKEREAKEKEEKERRERINRFIPNKFVLPRFDP